MSIGSGLPYGHLYRGVPFYSMSFERTLIAVLLEEMAAITWYIYLFQTRATIFTKPYQICSLIHCQVISWVMNEPKEASTFQVPQLRGAEACLVK